MISVYSEVGHGTTFTIYFPETEMCAGGPSPTIPGEPETLLGNETILVVEDDDSVRQLIARVLKRYGYRVHASHSAADALRLADAIEGPIHLVLTDIVMPGMNGCDLVDKLRGRRSESCLLFMSGYSDHAIRQHRFPVSDQQLLEKPFTSSELVRKIRQVLDASPESAS